MLTPCNASSGHPKSPSIGEPLILQVQSSIGEYLFGFAQPDLLDGDHLTSLRSQNRRCMFNASVHDTTKRQGR